jgi:hypothetical protein
MTTSTCPVYESKSHVGIIINPGARRRRSAVWWDMVMWMTRGNKRTSVQKLVEVVVGLEGGK